MYPYYSNNGVWLKKAIRRNEYIFYTFNGVLRSNSWSMLFCLRKCSVSCGQGIRKRQVDCKSADGQRSLGCDLEIKPAVKEGCNIRPCPSWMTGAWGKVRILFRSVNHSIQFFWRASNTRLWHQSLISFSCPSVFSDLWFRSKGTHSWMQW